MSESPTSPPEAPPEFDQSEEFEPPEFEPAHPRPRWDGWTPERQARFIQALGESACVAEACRAVGMSERSAYALRARVDAISFRNAWETALDYGVRRLSDATLSRAINGVAVPVFFKGEQIGEKRYYNERLAMFLLRYRDPMRYGKWLDRFEHRGHPETHALDLNDARIAIREDAALHADDIPRRFAQRVRELAAKVLSFDRSEHGGGR
jgi:hypothetical protein